MFAFIILIAACTTLIINIDNDDRRAVCIIAYIVATLCAAAILNDVSFLAAWLTIAIAGGITIITYRKSRS